MTPQQREAQLISHVYGNLHIENPNITRDMVVAALEQRKLSMIEGFKPPQQRPACTDTTEAAAADVARPMRMYDGTKPPPSYSPVYAAALYPELAVVFREHGYALAVHGSLRRDLDVIAVPWVAEPSLPETVVEVITTRWWIRQIGKPEEKEHGRVAYTISVGHGECAIDLSFMPTFPAAAFQGMRAHLASISPDERAELIPRLLDGYCHHCGDPTPCHCQNDE